MRDHIHISLLWFLSDVQIYSFPVNDTLFILLYMLDFSRIKAKGEQRGLDSEVVSIEQVPVYTSILVSGMSHNTTRDAILLHFESQRNSGGPVEKVYFAPESDRAVVVFQDQGGLLLFCNYTVCGMFI